MGYGARNNYAKGRKMKSFRLTRSELHLLRESVPTSPYPADPNGRQQGYSFDDLEMVEKIIPALDVALGEYRTERRNNTLHVDREMRRLRQSKDQGERELSAQIVLDASAEAIEALDQRLGGEQVVVSLEDAEAEWLMENWSKRTNWNGADAVRGAILAIRRGLKKDALIEWRRNDAEPPTSESFDQKTNKVVTLKPKTEATEASDKAEKVG